MYCFLIWLIFYGTWAACSCDRLYLRCFRSSHSGSSGCLVQLTLFGSRAKKVVFLSVSAVWLFTVLQFKYFTKVVEEPLVLLLSHKISGPQNRVMYVLLILLLFVESSKSWYLHSGSGKQFGADRFLNTYYIFVMRIWSTSTFSFRKRVYPTASGVLPECAD